MKICNVNPQKQLYLGKHYVKATSVFAETKILDDKGLTSNYHKFLAKGLTNERVQRKHCNNLTFYCLEDQLYLSLQRLNQKTTQ